MNEGEKVPRAKKTNKNQPFQEWMRTIPDWAFQEFKNNHRKMCEWNPSACNGFGTGLLGSSSARQGEVREQQKTFWVLHLSWTTFQLNYRVNRILIGQTDKR